MISRAEAQQFAANWIAAWNARDLARILSLYTEDFSMSSPKIVQFVGEQSGKLRGRIAVATYWKRALELRPDLHFRLPEVFMGVDTVCVTYESLDGQRASEWFRLDDDFRIQASAAHYAPPLPDLENASAPEAS